MTYSTLLGLAQRRWTEVLSPVRFISVRSEELMPLVRLDGAHSISKMLEDGRLAARLMQAYPADSISDFMSKQIEATASATLANLRSAVLKSALVFGHAILDDTLNESLQLGYELRPEFFVDRVADRKVAIKEMLGRGVADVTRTTVLDWIRNQQRESVPTKFKTLLMLTKPGDPDRIIQGFSFDMARIEAIDERRHGVVHRGSSDSVSPDDLEYLRLATNFAAGLLTEIGAEVNIEELCAGMGFPIGDHLARSTASG